MNVTCTTRMMIISTPILKSSRGFVAPTFHRTVVQVLVAFMLLRYMIASTKIVIKDFAIMIKMEDSLTVLRNSFGNCSQIQLLQILGEALEGLELLWG